MSDRDYDVIVVGGGPAGSATAICCAKIGKKVLLVEEQTVVRSRIIQYTISIGDHSISGYVI